MRGWSEAVHPLVDQGLAESRGWAGVTAHMDFTGQGGLVLMGTSMVQQMECYLKPSHNLRCGQAESDGAKKCLLTWIQTQVGTVGPEGDSGVTIKKEVWVCEGQYEKRTLKSGPRERNTMDMLGQRRTGTWEKWMMWEDALQTHGSDIQTTSYHYNQRTFMNPCLGKQRLNRNYWARNIS